MKTRNLLYILPLAALTACEPDIDEMEVTAGSADFSNMVAVGNSLTAGFQSNALRREKQEVSLPAMIAGQIESLRGEFKQPLMDAGVGLGSAGNAEFGLYFRPDCTGEVGPSPGPIAATGQLDQLSPANFVGAQGPFNNVGVPGARLIHLNFVGYGSAQGNPFFARFAANAGETMLQAAMRNNPTFFQLWIGNNDVLGYSTTGGDEGGDAITPVTTFSALYSATLDTLMKNGAKGVVANIPDVTSIPYFTTVPVGTSITEAQANQLNAAYAPYNGGLDAVVAQNAAFQAEADERKISFSAGINTFVVLDQSLTDLSSNGLPSIRQIKSGELLTLVTPGDSLKCAGWGTAKPIPGNFHLTADEISNINNATNSYNDIIKSEATSRGLAFVDANARMQELSTTGITIDGIAFSSDFVTGGAFSLDGVHPSTRGYAIIANDFISAINTTYGASIPKVNVGSYNTIEVAQ